MVSEKAKRKNLLDLEHQQVLNLINILVISVATLIISSIVAVWGKQLVVEQFLAVLIILIPIAYAFFLNLESRRQKVLKEISNL
jgi:hypothetical protein